MARKKEIGGVELPMAVSPQIRNLQDDLQTPTSAGDGEKGAAGLPAARSDDVAEASLQCVKTLIGRAGSRVDEVVPLLERLCPVLTLPRQSATEEVRRASGV